MNISEEIQCYNSIRPHWNISIVKLITIIIIISIFILLLIAFFIPNSPLKSVIISIITSLEDLSFVTASFLFILFYIVVLLLALPATPLNLAGGFLFGFSKGSLINTIGCFIGASIPCFIAKYFLQNTIKSYLDDHSKIHQIIQTIESNEFLMILLLRLSPLFPFPISNYVLGPFCSFQNYIVATFYGIIPGTIAYTYFGSVVKNVSDIFSNPDLENDWVGVSLMILIVISSIVLLVTVTIITRKAINNVISKKQLTDTLKYDDMIIITIN
ncbi:hypothetical protein, conserved [Entamoeba dispar SAW760]|uniref:VTT domain-containing protein n=1 Tax=Entamoeba dispar (strain ATCC PRA-260 / SAW760) TaxID=370354 RepID=B0EGK6_ENTDS|nr:uncharacterized protein EDI_244890 [Entamoeba dispar SAW760]EDR26338.1 hypothetical protein, conserved [Entamoeba dispar SAW760]|eukprot:EDR26338.1 hypothetical protein, conserved [Entamoeba dispar SAW760]